MMVPVVPLDDDSLRLLDESLDTCLSRNDDGEWVEVGGEFTLSRLLEFWSGIDEARFVSSGLHVDPITGSGLVEFREYPDAVLHEKDVIRALIREVLRLRAEVTR